MKSSVYYSDDEVLLDNLTKFFNKFNKLFENENIDAVVNSEFPRKYALLPLLVKAQLYYDEN